MAFNIKSMSEDKNKRGAPKKIETPEMMWEHFEAYKEEVKSNPLKQHDFVGKDGDSVYRKKERPLTLEGFENWLTINKIITDVSDYFENKDNRYVDFVPICRVIKRVIRQDQIEGGMAGIYNPSITQRLNGLTEKVQQETYNNTEKPDWLTKPIQ